jgi:dipeptidyl-peptidase-4
MLVLAGCKSQIGPAPAGVRPVHPASAVNPEFLSQYSATAGFTLGLPTAIEWVPDGSAVLFLRSGPRSFVRDLYEFDTATGRERLLLTADQVLHGAEEQLSAAERARRERLRMSARGLAKYHLSKDGSRILVGLSGRLFWIERRSGRVTEIRSGRGFPLDPRFSPDGASVSCVRDGELIVYELASGAERQLTRGAGGEVTNGLSEFVAQEEMGRFEGYWWSPDSAALLVQQTDTTGVERMHIMDAANPTVPPQQWPYPRPGRTNASVRLALLPAAGGEPLWVRWDAERYPYLAAVRWDPNSPPCLLVQNRMQTEEALLVLDPASGETRTLLRESDTAWLNLEPDMPRWLPNGRAFLWTTERNGAPQLELRAADGRLLRALTPPEPGYRGLVSVDEAGREAVYFSAGDPAERLLYRIALDAEEPVPEPLATEPGLHSAAFDESHSYHVHWFDGPSGRSAHVVRRRDGSAVGILRSVAETPPFLPRLELTRVGKEPGFHAALLRPRSFDPARRYPVIEHAYGGPGGTMASAGASRHLFDQWIADQGYVVVLIDGRGTPNRGREWERAIRGNLIDRPLEDHVAALRALGRKYRELDLSRVGVYGWSFGGYFAAMAVLRRPDVYHVAVAGAPVADWLYYDTHYTERYLGLPQQNPEAYRLSSVLTYAAQLSRPLLLIHGTTDDNVYFLHSLILSDALLRAGKPHEFLPLSNFTHMVAEPEARLRLNQRILEFFERHLGRP